MTADHLPPCQHIADGATELQFGHALASDGLGVVGEVAKEEQTAAWAMPQQAKELVVVRPNRGRGRLGVEFVALVAAGHQLLHPRKEPPRNRAGVVSLRGRLPIHLGAVHPAVVVGAEWVFHIAIVVHQPNLIAHVEQGNATRHEDDAVDEQKSFNGKVNLVGVVVGHGRFQPSQRSSCPRNAPVHCLGVHLKFSPA